MSVTVSIINLKGGVGKSTLAMMIAEYMCFRYKKRVLLIDMDAQANLSYIMVPARWITSQTETRRTIYHFFEAAITGQPANLYDFVARPPLIVSNVNRRFDLERDESEETLDMVISTPQVAQLDERLLQLWEDGQPMPRNLRSALREGIEQVQDRYDLVLIDCPPGLSFFSSTALLASDFFISPVIPEPLSLEGVKLVQNRARELSRMSDRRCDFAGVVLNVVKHYRRTHSNTAAQIYGPRYAELRPFVGWIPDNERVRTLGEFEIDTERIREGWAAGTDNKFHTVTTKYSVGYLLNNPVEGALSQVVAIEGPTYRINERLERIVEEVGHRIGI